VCYLTRAEVVEAVRRRHELCGWDYPPLTPAQASEADMLREALLRVER
jgi:hypothetical protein